jgi:hypothetical protein
MYHLRSKTPFHVLKIIVWCFSSEHVKPCELKPYTASAISNVMHSTFSKSSNSFYTQLTLLSILHHPLQNWTISSYFPIFICFLLVQFWLLDTSKYKFLMVVKMSVLVFCFVTLCILVDQYQCFGETYCLCLQDWRCNTFRWCVLLQCNVNALCDMFI